MNIASTPSLAPKLSGLPKERPPIGSRETTRAFDWTSLVPLFIHPVKVAVLEALDWVEQPLSATELALAFDCRDWSLGVVAYHVSTLARLGVLEVAGERQARGARESYYFFASSD